MKKLLTLILLLGVSTSALAWGGYRGGGGFRSGGFRSSGFRSSYSRSSYSRPSYTRPTPKPAPVQRPVEAPATRLKTATPSTVPHVSGIASNPFFWLWVFNHNTGQWEKTNRKCDPKKEKNCRKS